MSLTIQKVTSYFKDLEKFEELNNEAFPDEERMSIQEMLNLVQSKKIEVSALYDKQQFIGFYVLVIENHIGYYFLQFLQNNALKDMVEKHCHL